MKKIEILSIISLLFILALRTSTLNPGQENSHDAYYHVMMADFGPSFFMAKELPFMTMSYWSENFSDKELIFHAILFVIRAPLKWFGASTSPPFHVEYFIFAVIFLLSFFILARYLCIDNIYLYMLAMVSISPFLITRIVVLRPHMLSISLIMMSCIIFDKIRERKHLWLSFVVGFIMAWSYSNPHFILLPAVAFALPESRKNWRFAFCIPLLAFAGIIAGFAMHPQFPNTFINWKIQCIDVMLVSMDPQHHIMIGGELKPADLKFYKDQFWLFLITVVNLILFTRYIYAVGLGSVSKKVGAVFMITIVTTFGCIFAIRGVEYAVPFNLLSLGILIRENKLTRPASLTANGKLKVIFNITIICLLISVATLNATEYYRIAKKSGKSPFHHFASWLKQSGIPEGTVIVNINWSDFPFLFYAAPQYKYAFGVDPMFAYYKYPERVKRIEMFRTGRRLLSYEELFNVLNSRYVFVSCYNRQLAADMYKRGYLAIYQGKDGDLFDLEISINMNKK